MPESIPGSGCERYSRKLNSLIVLVVISTLFIACNSPAVDENSLTIAVASSLVLPVQELCTMYEKQSGIKSKIIAGSSGKLAAQISAGAPYDLFLSADTDYPQALVERGVTGGELIIFASGKLVLFIRTATLKADLNYLLEDKVKTIAVPNPDVAPYGRVAIKALKNVGIYEQVKAKLIYGENVGQVNQFLHGGAVDAGITAVTFAKMNLLDYTVTVIDTTLYPPIQHGAVLLKNAGAEAQAFLQFLLSHFGQIELSNY